MPHSLFQASRELSRFVREDSFSVIDVSRENWERGVTKADAQNVVRCLCETPTNYLTPKALATVSTSLCLLTFARFLDNENNLTTTTNI